MVVLLLGYGWCGLVSLSPRYVATFNHPFNLDLGDLMRRSTEAFYQYHRFVLLLGMIVLPHSLLGETLRSAWIYEVGCIWKQTNPE